MEYQINEKRGSNKIGVGYVILLLFPGTGTLLQLIGPRTIDSAILNLASNVNIRTLIVAFAYLLPGVVPGLISWFLGKSASKDDNKNAQTLKIFSILITCIYLVSQILRGFYENM